VQPADRPGHDSPRQFVSESVRQAATPACEHPVSKQHHTHHTIPATLAGRRRS
jgi:hypothetical protein